ncbi:hypothetical protein NQT69_09625 [Pseudoalteromonas shioyasakiensis]|uniref:hypothetical protein n=1 Tax=Pseudoalteromonas shioyasakiensis TaxID=1190813 RepID=UPI002117C96C|nr:hypothetical protein [Pseudoalteromonas shioyasakiensis]MCQ8878256.1 hypothetical protein [Pseudoalteromonas shioyasakiensis]
MIKRILFPTLLIFSHNLLAQQTIYSQSTCEQLQQAQQNLQKQINSNGSAQNKQQLIDKKSDLADTYTKYCRYFNSNHSSFAGQEKSQAGESNDTTLQKFNQLPPRCTQPTINQATQLWCDELKIEQRALFESHSSANTAPVNQMPTKQRAVINQEKKQLIEKAPAQKVSQTSSYSSSTVQTDTTNEPDTTKLPIWVFFALTASVFCRFAIF